ncbi:autotransporter outer membrane beta-barrel domain-containing protein [Campylobacter armoricus]|uniref:Autotransporter domain-containing protein n=4 Tax=Campylobacter armoricus TaxID=2505970 RepID=A0A7L5I8W8_9BACT|nr:autotransporter outer membrane beta-barrel domain-containing protein [Campylobacter armoricus]QKF80480.1 autotransporter domain-containing protein [Campylobacter armoricus]
MSYFTGGGIDFQSNQTSSLTNSFNSFVLNKHITHNNLSFTKKTFLSLATISFLATCANASITTINDKVSNGSITIANARSNISRDISGGGCSNRECTITDSKSGGVTISGNNGGTLTITDKGNITNNNKYGSGVLINGSATNVNINNSGTIDSTNTNNQSGNGISVEGNNNNNITITNSGSINSGTFNGIEIKGSNNTINNLTNSGIITGKGNGISVNGSNNVIKTLDNSGFISGIRTQNQGSIETIDNEGTIGGVTVQNQGSIKTIDNKGTIGSVFVDKNSVIQNLMNHGTINKDVLVIGNITSIINDENSVINGGIKTGPWNGSINTIINKGAIDGNDRGIYIASSTKLIENSGVISGNNAGIGTGNGANIQTISNSGTITGKKGDGLSIFSYGGGVKTVNNNGLIQGNNNGIIVYGEWGRTGTIDTINNDGRIIGKNNGINIQEFSGNNNLNTNIGTIISKGTILGQSGAGIRVGNGNQHVKNYIQLDGPNALIAGGKAGIHNKGTIGVNNNGTSVNNGNVIDLKNGATIASLKQEKDALKYDESGTAILNEGTIKGNISLDKSFIYGSVYNKNTIGGNISLNNKSYISSINNEKNIQGSIDLKEQSHINSILNNGTIEKGISLDKSTIGTIVNTGIIGNEASPLATQDITYGINNSGTIEKLINSSGDINNPNTDKDIHIYGGINNSGYIDIFNTGNIHGGITNSGTLILSNGHIHSGNGSTQASWHGGFIGKNNNGYHIENNDNGKVSIDGWYFNDLEYKGTTQEDIANRLENAIIVGGNNIGGISADKIYVNTSNLKLNTIYEGNTFFIDENGKVIGDKINNNAGVNANNIHSLSGIYDFLGLGEGRYIANVNVSELSGKTLAKSMVYSARLRNINISNILRDTTAKNFQTEFSQVLDMELSKKGEAYGNDADLLAELEDIFIPNKNPNAKNHSFLIPYYNHSSIKIGNSVGQLSANTTGLIGGSLRELPNDYGTIGFYLGYEDASKEQATQRLKFDDKTYYGGLTYYGVLARDGIDQYYISASTRFDYTTTDIEKTYKNIPATIESDTQTYGYGIDVKVGANYYNTLEIARITPEIGLSYYGMSNKNFSLKHIDGLREHYLAEQFNFIDASAALKWYKPWSDKLRSNVTIGAIVNLYEDAKGNLRLGANHFTTEVQTSKYYGFGQLGLSYNIANNADLSLNYAGAFTFDNTTSHTMFLKLGLWW